MPRISLSLTVSQLKLLPSRGRLRSPLRPSMAAVVPKTLASLTSMSGVEVGVARKFWIKFYSESVFSMYTPFAVSLAAGNLDVGTFRNYVAQDAWFLKAFAQAYSLAEECADDDEAKISISELRKDVMEELKMHDSFAQEWGSEITKESTPNSATVKYTDFLLATASGKVEGVKVPGNLATPFEKTKVAAYTLGAMTPCMRLYAFLGEEFQKLLYNDERSHPYKKWIDNYSNENFQAAALKTEEVLDKLSVPLTGEELDVIEKLYHQAMKLEIEFFLAQPLAQPTSVPLIKDSHLAESRLLFFSDFDLTCTVVDSSAILAEIAIVTAPKSDQTETQNQLLRMSSAELRKTWDLLSKQYTEEFEKCIESILPLEKVDEFNYENLVKAFKELSDFEKRANSRVIESGVLKGLNIDDIKRAGQKMILQDGCISFFQKLLKNENLDVNVHVLSYCWSGDLIRSALLSGDLQVLNIHTNELTFDESISTGEIVKKIESPVDKAQAFDDILKACENDNKKVLTIYVGDSVGDLLCLLKADIGIVVGSSSSLRRVGSQFGISFMPLFSGVVKKQRDYREGSAWGWKGPSGTLYTVSSWAEIHAFTLGW